MADVALHITINKAGDPEKLAALVNAAIAVNEPRTEKIVPEGYRCVECYRDDGGHDKTCSVGVFSQTKEPEDEGNQH